jgi:hypothetical protein
VITVRLVSLPDSSSKVRDAFTAIVTGLNAVGGEVVVSPGVGVAASGKVIGVKAKEKTSEMARPKLVLKSITIDGMLYPIETKLIENKANGESNSKTTTTGGGAASEVLKVSPTRVNSLRTAACA